MGNNMTPNIPSVGYPNVDNVNTWLTQTTFNYALWAANSKLTVTRVPWNEEYKDVVKFADDAARDAYFASIESISKKIDNAVRIPKDGTVVLPFNFDEIITYNYLIAEYPLPNGYSKKGNKIKTKFFYFIVDMTYKNANVTECTVVLDYWTTFINDVDIGNSCLHRGHAPMTLTSVDDFLDSPIDHTQGLLTPDVNFGEATQVKNEDFISFHTAEQYIGFATSAYMEKDWTDNVTCCTAAQTDGVPNNLMVFVIPASNYGKFCTAFEENVPQFAQTIEGIFICDASFITLGSSFTFCGITCYHIINKKSTIKNIYLDKYMFDYDSNYDWITKLYTFPYAQLEVTDNNGNTANIKIEDTSSSFSVKSMSSFVFPFLNIEAFLSGVNGSGSNTYVIKRMTEYSAVEMGIDGWQNYKWSIDIPVFAIYQQNSIAYDYGTKFDRIQQQNDINTSYDNTAASAQTSYENTAASAQTSYNNTAASAQTSYNNTAASAQTSYNNTAASAQTSYDNSKDSIDNTKAIAEDAIQTEQDVTDQDISYNIEINDKTMFYQGDQFELQAWNQEVNAFAADAGKFSNTVGGAMAAIGTVAAGLALGPAGGAAAAATEGAASAGISSAGLASTGIQSLGVASSIGSYCGNADVSTGMWGNQKSLIERQANRYVEMQNDLYGSDGGYSIDISTSTIESIAGVSGTYEALDLSIPTRKKEGLVNKKTRAIKGKIWDHEEKVKDDNYDVSSTNNSRSRETADANNTRSKATADANNTRSKTTADANNTRSKATADANNERSKNTADVNNARSKENSEAAIENAINQAALRPNNRHGSYSGNAQLEVYGTRGLDIKVKTQNADSIRKAANIFTRYGYTFDDAWTPSNLNLMTLFTYWEFSDIWLTSDRVFETGLNVLRDIFTSGVTVWSNPSNIGRVNINSNRIA